MPMPFEKCQAEGGKIRRVSGPSKKDGLKAGEYVNYCIKDGVSHRGYVQKMKGMEGMEGKSAKRYA